LAEPELGYFEITCDQALFSKQGEGEKRTLFFFFPCKKNKNQKKKT